MIPLFPLLKCAQMVLVLPLELIAIKTIQITYRIAANGMIIGVILLKKTQILALIVCRLL